MPHKRSLPNLFVKIILFALGCCAGFFLVARLANAFHIKTIEVSGMPSKEKATIVSLLKGQSTLFFNEEQTKKILVNRIPALEGLTLALYYPDKIVVYGHIAAPVAYLVSDEGYLTLSGQGIIIAKTREAADKFPKPAIYLYEIVHHNAYQSGQSIDYSSIKRALHFLQLLYEEGYSVERVDIDSVDMIACKVAEVDILFSQTKSIETQQNEFKQIAKQMKIGALRVVRLDLRFSKPVVELKK